MTCSQCGKPLPSQPVYLCDDCIKPFPVVPLAEPTAKGRKPLVERLRDVIDFLNNDCRGEYHNFAGTVREAADTIQRLEVLLNLVSQRET
jgi:hypothetical protein